MKAISRVSTQVLLATMTFAMFGMSVGSAQAATVYFLQIDGISGASTNNRHRDWIDIDSFSWGIKNSGSVGSGGGSSVGKAVFSPFSWTQQVNKSVPPMTVGVASGKHYLNATLDVQQEGKTPFVFFRMSFDDVQLTALDIAGAGGVQGVTAALNYSKITMTYWPQKADGGLGSPVIGGWDLKKNSAAAFFGSPDVLQGLFLAGPTPSAVPVPAAVWLLGSGLLGLIGVARRVTDR